MQLDKALYKRIEEMSQSVELISWFDYSDLYTIHDILNGGDVLEECDKSHRYEICPKCGYDQDIQCLSDFVKIHLGTDNIIKRFGYTYAEMLENSKRYIMFSNDDEIFKSARILIEALVVNEYIDGDQHFMHNLAIATHNQLSGSDLPTLLGIQLTRTEENALIRLLLSAYNDIQSQLDFLCVDGSHNIAVVGWIENSLTVIEMKWR